MDDLKKIKKLYGESMTHLCRELFPSILESKGVLPKLLESHFAPSHELYYDIIDEKNQFQNYIYSFTQIEKQEETLNKTPQELLSEAGYNLYECHTEDDIQSFRKYYDKREELCTFNGGRLVEYYVFFAVKKNIDEIKRSDFPNPERQDEYGTSILSIQFCKSTNHYLSIKNRYNHTVLNPDSTFSNNLDNIIPGLTKAFETEYGLKQANINNTFEIPNYILASDNRFYKYNYEINNIYYGIDNVIIDNGKVKKYDKEKYIIMDYFILDLVNKNIYLYNDFVDDSLTNILGTIKNIEIEKKNNEKIIQITNEYDIKFIITLNKKNQIIEFEGDKIEYIPNNFLYYNKTLKKISLANVKKIENNFLYNNLDLEEIEFLQLEYIGNSFIYQNEKLSSLHAPLLNIIMDKFLYHNKELTCFIQNDLEYIGNYCLYSNQKINYISCLNLKEVKDKFLGWNTQVTMLYLPLLEKVGNDFFNFNKSIIVIFMPLLEEVGDGFLNYNSTLVYAYLPALKKVRDYFMLYNRSLKYLNLPSLIKVGNAFLYFNETIIFINLPNLTTVGDSFMYYNKSILNITLPLLEETGYGFFYTNSTAETLNCPKLTKVGYSFCELNPNFDKSPVSSGTFLSR